MSKAPRARPDIAVVILGGDIGVYAFARAFHEEYGISSTVISGSVPGPIAASRILENVVVDDSHDARQLVDAALRVVGPLRAAGKRTILLANSDWLVRVLVRHRIELQTAGYIVPFLDEDLLDRISDKATFAQVARVVGISVPRTIVQNFAHADHPTWSPVPVDITYPLIAKPASSADYQDIDFEGKQKVYEIAGSSELMQLWRTLQLAGFRGSFVVQELIPGDDTQMRSITAYVDSRGVITLMAGAQVLVEEHTPNGLGNPAAMITMDLGPMFAQARRFLEYTNYRGYANFDIKVDPRDGTFAFFEVNPRIGRNNYYVTAAGANVAKFLVADHIDRLPLEPTTVRKRILYSILPNRLLSRYVLDPSLAAQLTGLIQMDKTVHPLRYKPDMTSKRRAYIASAAANQVRKFRKYYPEVSGTGF